REREVRRLTACGDEPLDVVDADPLLARPGSQLVDLGRQLVQILAYELDQNACSFGLDLRSVNLELLADPPLQPALRDIPEEQLAARGHRLRQWRILLQLACHERKRRRGCGRL